MRTLVNFNVVLSFLVFLFIGCSDDDTEKPAADPPQSTAVDTIKMGENTPGTLNYQIDRGSLYEYFTADTEPIMYTIMIELTSQNYSYEEYAGDVMVFYLVPKPNSDFQPGNYKFYSSNEFGLSEGFLITNGEKFILDDGDLLIEQLQTGYSLTWQVKGYREASSITKPHRVFITGSYQGPLPVAED